MQQTIKVDGKIFALECECPERGGHKWEKIIQSNKKLFKDYRHPVPSIYCEKCGYFTWYILPNKAVKNIIVTKSNVSP